MGYPYYQPSYYPMSQPAMPNFTPNMIAQQPQVTVLYNVPSEDVAYRWNVEPNRSVNFINENQGYIYKKSVGASILEPPVFERYKLVKENNNIDTPQASTTAAVEADLSEYVTKSEFEAYKTIIDDMRDIVKELKGNE